MKPRSLCKFALIFLSVSRYAISTDCTEWNTSGLQAWDTAGNWTTPPSGCSGFPNAVGDDAAFSNGSTSTVGLPIQPSITITGLHFLSGTTTINFGGKSLIFDGVSPAPTIQVASGTQTIDTTNLTLNNTTGLVFSNGSTLNIVGNSATSGTRLDVSGTGFLNVGNGSSTTILSPSIINLNGSTVTNAVNSIISDAGAGTASLTMNGGTLTNNGVVGLTLAGGTETITINSGSTVNNNAAFGDSFAGGTTNITINGGTITNIGVFCLGDSSNISSTVTVTGGTITNSGEFFTEGLKFEMTGGMLTNNNAALGAVNDVEISGGTITNTASGSMGDANYNMSAGTLINDGVVSIGFIPGPPLPPPPSNIFTQTGGLVQGNGFFINGSSFSSFIFSNSGTVMPGDPISGGGFSPGTLTFGVLSGAGNGTYQQNANGKLIIAIDNASSFGQIRANQAVLNGNPTLVVEGLPDFNIHPGDELTIVATTNGVTGTFDPNIQASNIDSLTAHLRYTANDVILFFTGFPSSQMCPVLNCYAGSFYETIITSVNRINIHLEREIEKMRMHFAKNTTRASKEIASISKRSNQLLADNSAWPYVKNAPAESLFADEDWFGVNTETVEKQEIMKREIQTRDEYPLNVYIGPLGSVGDFESRERGRQVGFDYWSAGVLAGFDYVFDQAGVGLLANYERFEGDVDKHWGEFTINEAHAAAYATYAPAILPEMAFDAIVGGGYDWVSIRRNTSTSKAEGHPNTGEFDALFEAEYTFASRQFDSFSKNLQVIPLANVQYVYLTIDDYTEHGGSSDFSFNKQRIDSLRSTVGARVNYNWECPNVSFIPELYLAWQREYLDTDHTVRATPVTGGPASFIEIDGVGRNFALVGADFLFTFYKRWGLEFSYDFEWNDLFTDNFFFAGVNVRF